MKTSNKWIKTKADKKAISQGCYMDLAAGNRVVQFFEKFLVHSKGQWAGKPFKPLKWQSEDLLKPLFGWKRPNGKRRFKRAYVQVSKKNGKSTIGAGISIYLLVGDNEPGAEVYNAATTRKQASIVFKEAANMVEKSSGLKKRLTPTFGPINSETRWSMCWAMRTGKAGKRSSGASRLAKPGMPLLRRTVFWLIN